MLGHDTGGGIYRIYIVLYRKYNSIGHTDVLYGLKNHSSVYDSLQRPELWTYDYNFLRHLEASTGMTIYNLNMLYIKVKVNEFKSSPTSLWCSFVLFVCNTTGSKRKAKSLVWTKDLMRYICWGDPGVRVTNVLKVPITATNLTKLLIALNKSYTLLGLDRHRTNKINYYTLGY